jgi:mono/diheme cytochrome c family protein
MKKNTKLLASIVLGASVIAAIAACSAYDLGSERPKEIPINAANPTWEGGIQAIVAKRCDNCHARVQGKFVPGDVKPFNFGMSESEAEFAKHLSGAQLWVYNKPENPMPPKYSDQLFDNEKAALKKYLENKLSAKTFDTSLCPTNITSTTLTFAADIKPIGDASCKTCHSAASGAAAGGGRIVETLENYKQFRISIAEYMKGVHAGTFKAMPPGGNFAQANKLLEWVCFSPEAK